MSRKPVPFDTFNVKAHDLWANQWLLLTCGDLAKNDFNAMAVGWGSFGTMWSRPFAQVVVRPTRYTHTFMEKYDSFTLCAFPEKHRAAVKLLGSKSGRDTKKILESGLTPIPSTRVASPGYDEAELIVECRKMYWDDFAPAHFIDPNIDKNYPKKDYHRIYFGEILAIHAVGAYMA